MYARHFIGSLHTEKVLYHVESWELMKRRWRKLIKDFRSKKDRKFDISKIPDIYDNIKYDLQHNQTIIEFEHAEPLHAMSKAMADLVIPQVSARRTTLCEGLLPCVIVPCFNIHERQSRTQIHACGCFCRTTGVWHNKRREDVYWAVHLHTAAAQDPG